MLGVASREETSRRRIGRDVKAVHGDVRALLACGILSNADDGQIVFPFDKVHVDFMLDATRGL